MSDLTLFDLDVEEWAPVWEPKLTDFGWHRVPDSALIFREDGTPISKAEWNSYLASGRCRDCGIQCSITMGGAGKDGSFRICDGCGQLDRCHIRSHTTVIEVRPAGSSFPAMVEAAHCMDCGWWMFTEYWNDDHEKVAFTPEEVIDACGEHEIARWSSHWGNVHELHEHDGLLKAQQQRRTKYLARVAVAA